LYILSVLKLFELLLLYTIISTDATLQLLSLFGKKRIRNSTVILGHSARNSYSVLFVVTRHVRRLENKGLVEDGQCSSDTARKSSHGGPNKDG